jgi:hypothetical protein
MEGKWRNAVSIGLVLDPSAPDASEGFFRFRPCDTFFWKRNEERFTSVPGGEDTDFFDCKSTPKPYHLFPCIPLSVVKTTDSSSAVSAGAACPSAFACSPTSKLPRRW